MALMVLLSTLSVTIEKHYCADTLVDVAVFSEAKSCCASSTKTTTPEKLNDNKCCKNEIDFIKGQDELQSKTGDDYKTPVKDLASLSLLVPEAPFFLQEYHSTAKIPYQPPQLRNQLFKLHEVYLI